MEKTGIRINKTTYEVFIAALLRCNEVDRARDQFQRMRKDAVRPDEEMFFSVMQEYAKKNDFAQLIELLRTMKDMRVKATHHSLTALTINIGKEKAPVNTVDQLVDLMQRAGYKLDIVGYPRQYRRTEFISGSTLS